MCWRRFHNCFPKMQHGVVSKSCSVWTYLTSFTIVYAIHRNTRVACVSSGVVEVRDGEQNETKLWDVRKAGPGLNRVTGGHRRSPCCICQQLRFLVITLRSYNPPSATKRDASSRFHTYLLHVIPLKRC